MFILAKSKLVLLRERLLTISKLELRVAVIAARVRETVLHEISFHPEAISFHPEAIYLWADSKIFIRYVQNEKEHFALKIQQICAQETSHTLR